MDVVPFGGVEAEDRTVTYPSGGNIHSVLGFRECEEHCVTVDVGDGLSVRAVTTPGLVVLKAHAYLDRRPALTHDLQDIDFIARTYEDACEGSSVFDLAAEVLQDERVTYEHVGAYLLGLAIAKFRFADAVLAPLCTLLKELGDPMSVAVDDVQDPARRGLVRDRETIVLRYAAMRLGLKL